MQEVVNMSYVLIGNIIALIACLLMVYSGILKSKIKIIYTQTIYILLCVISNLVLGAFTGAIVNALNGARNIIYYKNKLSFKTKIVLTILLIIFSLIFNNAGFIGLLPLIGSVLYIWCIHIKNITKFKIVIIIYQLLWLIYDVYVKLFVFALFEFMTIITNVIAIIQINMKRK